jgi:hypothetical protein
MTAEHDEFCDSVAACASADKRALDSAVHVNRQGVVTQADRRLGYLDRHIRGDRKWRYVLEGGASSGFKFPTRREALADLLKDPSCPYRRPA